MSYKGRAAPFPAGSVTVGWYHQAGRNIRSFKQPQIQRLPPYIQEMVISHWLSATLLSLSKLRYIFLSVIFAVVIIIFNKVLELNFWIWCYISLLLLPPLFLLSLQVAEVLRHRAFLKQLVAVTKLTEFHEDVAICITCSTLSFSPVFPSKISHTSCRFKLNDDELCMLYLHEYWTRVQVPCTELYFVP
jgi:hypothetical protein